MLHDAAVAACLLSPAAASGVPDPDGFVRVDLALEDGRIAAISSASTDSPKAHDGQVIDLHGYHVWPCFIDMHTHLDKGHIWPRAANPDGTFDAAIAAAAADRSARWTAEDVDTRMRFGLKAAYAHGSLAMRTHLDSVSPQHAISWPVFARLRDEWRDRITLEAVSILLLEQLQGSFGDELADLIATHDGVLGAVVSPSSDLSSQLDRLFALAAARGLDIDLHADESGDAAAAGLRAIAQAKLRYRFDGKVTVGHCCSLALQPDAEVDRTLDLVAQAGLIIVSLPMCNMYLQDRHPGRTPRWRGITLLHEMHARGVATVLASDNCRDPFFAYGDHDMLEVLSQAVRIAHLDRPFAPWPAAVTRTPAHAMSLSGRGWLAAGHAADLILFNARSANELLSRPQSDRVVLRGGRPIDTTLPSYRELDGLMSAGGSP